MRIERISDTQVKFILTREDFSERDLSISELTYNSEKAQQLFRDMMEMASAETGFEVEHSPLVIEAVPLAVDSLMIIVSKVSGKKNEESTSPLSGLLKRLSRSESSYSGDSALEYKGFEKAAAKKADTPRNIAIYSFDSLDDVSTASSRLMGTFFKGASSLYKYNGKYFICLQLPSRTAHLKMSEIENVMCEYGEKHISNKVSRGFLLEHGEKIIEINAVNKLAHI